MKWARHVARMGERKFLSSVWVEKPEAKRPLGRTSYRWKANIKWIFKKRNGRHGLDCCHSEWGHVAGTYKSGYEPFGSVQGGGGCPD